MSLTIDMMKKHHEQKFRKTKSQISSLENCAAQFESCLHTLETSPETYFKNLNPHNKKYTEFRKQLAESTKSNNDEEDMLSNEAEEECGATASTGGAGNLGFFFKYVWNFSQYCHISADEEITLFFFIWMHCLWISVLLILQAYIWG